MLGVMIAFCLATAPMLSMASDLHELSHGIEHLQQEHAIADPDHDEEQDGIHSVLHGVHSCGHGVGILPEVVALKLSCNSGAPAAQQDIWRGSTGPDLLFRPPRS